MGWASELLAKRAKENSDEGFSHWEKPGDAGSSLETSGSDTAGKPQWGTVNDPNASWKDVALEGAGDAAYSAAHGVFTGLGFNPSEVAPGIAARQLLGQERSPYSSAAGGFAGEVASQVATGVGPVVGGALSGIGNTEGSLEQKAVGGLAGGAMGHIAGAATGKLSQALGLGADAAEREAMNRGLTQSGATAADLRRLDELGGRQYFAEGANRLGLTGRPGKVLTKAERLAQDLEAQRAGLVGDAPPDVDANALYSSVAGSSQRYPGITPIRNATERMAGDVDNIANSSGNAAPWDAVNGQRKYYGDKTNFASGTPEANVRKDVYRAYNDEMGDALSLKNPGAGDKWRQAGMDEQIAMEMGDIASGGVDRARNRDFSFTGAAARGIGDLVGGPLPKQAQAGLQRGAAAGLPPLVGPTSGQFAEKMVPQRSQPENSEDTVEAALTLLQTNPKELGGFSSKIAEAAASPERNTVRALIQKLIMTDETFRTQILPKLTAAGQGSYRQ